MNAALLFAALVLLAFVGNIWAGGQPRRESRKDSGLGYLLVGVVLGPPALGWVSSSVLAEFEAPIVAAAGWLALVDELHGEASPDDAPSSLRPSALHSARWVIVVALFTAGAVFGVARLYPTQAVEAPLVLALGGACLAADAITRPWRTARRRWFPTPGIAARWLLGVCAATIYGLLLARPFTWALWQVVLASVALGVSAGIAIAALSHVRPVAKLDWAFLLGAALVATGLALRLNVSPITAMVAMGATLRLMQGEASPARLLAENTEQAVRVPLLVLFGMSLRPLEGYAELWLPIVALVGLRLGVRALAASCAAAFGRLSSERIGPLRKLVSWSAAAPSHLTLVILLALELRVRSDTTAVLSAAALLLVVLSELGGERHLTDGEESRYAPSPESARSAGST